MTELDGILTGIASRAAEATGCAESDYIGADGLVYCGECNSPKQVRITLGGREVVVPCVCRHRNEEQERIATEQKKKARIEAILRANAAYPELHGKTFENWEDGVQPVLKRHLLKYAEILLREDETPGLCLWGAFGTGKSYGAAALYNRFVENGISCRWRSFAKMMSFEYDIEEELERLKHTAVIFLDDFGAQRGTEFATERAFLIADTICASHGKLIVTTNLSADEIENPKQAELGRIYSRINEKCVKLQVKGGDMRKAIESENIARLRKLFRG